MSISGAGKKPFVAPSGSHKPVETQSPSTPSMTPAAKLDDIEEKAAAAVDAGVAANRAAKAQTEAAEQAKAMAQVADLNERKEQNYQALKELEASPEGQALMKFMKSVEHQYPTQYVNLAAPGPDIGGGASLALTSHGIKVWENWEMPKEVPLKTLLHGIHHSVADVRIDDVRSRLAAAVGLMENAVKTGKPPPEFGVKPDLFFESRMHGRDPSAAAQQTLEELDAQMTDG
jgi:hypothetical protein